MLKSNHTKKRVRLEANAEYNCKSHFLISWKIKWEKNITFKGKSKILKASAGSATVSSFAHCILISIGRKHYSHFQKWYVH